MSDPARFVVEQLDLIVKPDGGSVRLVAREGSRLRVAYAPGTNEECAACVIPPEMLETLLREQLRQHDPSITEVEVVELDES